MRRLLTLFVLLLLCFVGQAQFRGLIVNEFSQGNTGNREYIELLVAGTKTCTDSTADLRGWIFDDQNGWYGITNGAPGHYRFANVANWATVPFGAVILIYNPSDKNLSISIADDPSDANKDYTYIAPINNSFLEQITSQPTNTSGPAYVYPTTGYGPATNQWNFIIALNNSGGDVLNIVSPNDRANPYYSIGYGYTIDPGFRNPSVSIANVGGGNNVWLSDSNYLNAASWNISAVPANESPGLPNGGLNSSWILSMRKVDSAFLPQTSFSQCINQGQSYNFNGQVLTSGGHYNTTFIRPGKCDSLVHLYLVVANTVTRDTSACESIIINGITYTSSGQVRDTTKSIISTCDSIITITNITINPVKHSYTSACHAGGTPYNFFGQSLTASGNYTHTLASSAGCDSIIHLNLVISATQSQTLTGCDSVIFNGIPYTSSLQIRDTLKSVVASCDSIITVTNIIVNPSKHSFINRCLASGQSFFFNGQNLTISGNYLDTFTTTAGCDSIIHLNLVVSSTTTVDTSGCGMVIYNSINYTSNTVLRDTIKSVVNNCDSIYNVINIIVYPVPAPTNARVCLAQGQTYNFNGTVLTTTGNYTTQFSTANGCDSTVNLYLLITRSETVTLQGCSSVVYNGITYTSSTTFNQNISSVVFTCDSINRTVNIQISNSVTTNLSVCRQQGQTYNFNGIILTSTGFYTDTLASVQGCDSIIKLYLVISNVQTQNFNGCGSYTHNGITYTSSVTLNDTVSSIVNNCDSIIRIVNIVVNLIPVTAANQCLQQGQSYNFNGQMLNTTGNYSTTFVRPGLCDSIVNLYLVVSTMQTNTVSGCGSVNYNGTVYTASTIVRDTIKSIINNCDSIIRIANINVYSASPPTNTNVCLATGQSYNFNGTILNATGNYSANFTNTNGCDSMVNLYLLITRPETLTLQGCSFVIYNGVTYTSSATLNQTILSVVFGCDSIQRTINIQISSQVTSSLSACLQQGQTYNFNGQVLSSSGHYTDTTTSVQGCDSIIHLQLVFSITQTQTVSGCGSYTYNGIIYTSSTQIRDTIRSVVTICDSIYNITNIVINPLPQTNTNACLVAGQSYNFNGQILTVSGNYSTTFVRPGLCDSIVNLNLIVSQTQSQTIQGCGSVTYNGITYTSSTIIRDTLQSISGCDSIYLVVNISLGNAIITNASACLQPGQTYNFNGQILTASGNYTTTYIRPGLCDSIVNLYLVVTQQQTQNISGCGSVMYNGTAYTTSTQIRDTLQSIITSCDSLYRVVNILVNPLYNLNTTACIAPGQTYIFNGQVITVSGQYSTSFTSSAGCDSTVNLYAVVARAETISVSGCEAVQYNGTTYTSSTVIQQIIPSILSSCDSIIRTVNISVNPKPQLNISPDAVICKGDSITLNATAVGSTIEWIGISNSNSITVSPLVGTTYTAVATNSNGCTDTASVTVNINDFNLNLFASPNPAIAGTRVVLRTTASNNYQVISWQPAFLFANQTVPQQIFIADTTITISVTAKSALGCFDTDSVTVIVDPLDDIYIPSAFTPNNDGKNDLFTIAGGSIQNMDLKIFNRWGQMIFASNSRSRGWDGKFSGKEQPAGAYVYNLSATLKDGKVVNRKGTVLLIR